MSEFTEDQLFAMSDEQFDDAYNKASQASSDSVVEPEGSTEEVVPLEESTELEVEAPAEEVPDVDVQEEKEENSEEAKQVASEAVDELPENLDTKSDTESGLEKESTDTEEVLEEIEPVDTVKEFKANGKTYSFTSSEMEEHFPKIFGQAMDYTKKMQAIKPYRKRLDAIQEAGLTEEDINLAIDMFKGDKAAVAELLKRTGLDALDLGEEDSVYKPNEYGRDETTLDIEEVVRGIKGDTEYTKTYDVITNEWDEGSKDSIAKDPNIINILHNDIKSGVYDKIQPMAEKLKLFNPSGKTNLEYYIEAATQFNSNNQQISMTDKLDKIAELTRAKEAEKLELAQKEADRLAKAKQQEAVRATDKVKSAERKKATTSKPTSTASGKIDYLNASDEEFEKWLVKMKDR